MTHYILEVVQTDTTHIESSGSFISLGHHILQDEIKQTLEYQVCAVGYTFIRSAHVFQYTESHDLIQEV